VKVVEVGEEGGKEEEGRVVIGGRVGSEISTPRKELPWWNVIFAVTSGRRFT
jgi:hypothetical protein